MSEKDIIKYYNKFCEDKRLKSRHGQVEFFITMEYIKKYLSEFKNPKVIDVGAGTGRYSFALSELGADVTAVELVKYNLGVLKSKGSVVKAMQGDARNLKKFKNESFDIVLLFGPMYHLLTYEDKVQAMSEAKRIVKKGGLIFVSYLMNEYAILVHGFKEGKILEEIKNNRVGDKYKVEPKEPDLYSYVRIEEMDHINQDVGLVRENIIAQDGASDYMREVLNNMSDEMFKVYLDYQLSVCERKELLGASSHCLDILRK